MPVYLLTYMYRNKSYQVVANGYTGKVQGRHPLSFWKVFGFVILGAVVLVATVYLVTLLHR